MAATIEQPLLEQPLLIGEDFKPLEALQRAQKKVFSSIEAVKQAYDVLNLGAFTQAVYSAIIEGKERQIKEQYMTEARQSVERLNIPNQQIRQNLLAGTEERFLPFAEACQALRQTTFSPASWGGEEPFPLQVITIVEGEPTLTEEAKEAFIESRCRTYVNSAQERKAYQQFKQMEEACNNFNTMLREAGLPISMFDLRELNQVLTKSEEGKVSFKPDIVKWIAGKL